MNLGIGSGKTREDHRNVADQLYASYAQGRDLRRLVSIIGEEALTEQDRKYLKFADDFEENFVSQKSDEDRDVEDTLAIAWDLLSMLPKEELKRIKPEYIAKYMKIETGPEEPEEAGLGKKEELSEEQIKGKELAEEALKEVGAKVKEAVAEAGSPSEEEAAGVEEKKLAEEEVLPPEKKAAGAEEKSNPEA
jgi:vacuolar-type H+-ATPase catalytic subunit A/Vma1